MAPPKQLQAKEGTSGKPDDLLSDAGRLRVGITGTVTNTDAAGANTLIASGQKQTVNPITTQIFSDPISLPVGFVRGRRDLWQLQIEKPNSDASGDLTVKVFNVGTLSTSNGKFQIAEFTVPMVSGVATLYARNIEGLFTGESTPTVVLGFTFALNSGTPIVYYRLSRV